jgi:plasmid stability protein
VAQVLVRELEPQVVARLKARAERHGRSLEAELREILKRAADAGDFTEARSLATILRRRLAGRVHTDSALLMAEDRER